MEQIYRAKDGKEYDNEKMCKKHEDKLDTLYSFYEKMQMASIFEKINIKPFFHNEQIENLGEPSLSDWDFKKHGYKIMGGRMGNPDTFIVMQLENDSKTIHFYKADFDENDVDFDGYKYLTSIPTSIIDELYFVKE